MQYSNNDFMNCFFVPTCEIGEEIFFIQEPISKNFIGEEHPYIIKGKVEEVQFTLTDKSEQETILVSYISPIGYPMIGRFNTDSGQIFHKYEDALEALKTKNKGSR